MPDPNVIKVPERAFVKRVSLPAAPAAGATVVLFTTHPRATGGVGAVVAPSRFERSTMTQDVVIDPDTLEEVEITWQLHDQASAANGLRAYVLDQLNQWQETDIKGYVMGFPDQPSIGAAAPIQVPLLAAGQEWSEQFKVGRYRGIAIEYTAGPVGPTAVTGWALTISVKYSEQGGQ